MLEILLMLLYFMATTESAFKVYDEIDETQDRVKTHNELNKVWSNTICCVKNLRCCHKEQDVQIKAVLVACKNKNDTNISGYEKMLKIDPAVMHRYGFYGSESYSFITSCRKKLLLTIKFHTLRNRSNMRNQYLVVDYVSDPRTHRNKRLLTPYVIKFKQEVITQMYRLEFLQVVNSNAEEKVFNKHSANYSGCDTLSKTPICGKISYDGKDVPYSEGFCCSCDDSKNARRQPKPVLEYVEEIVTYSDPAFLLNGNECPRYLKAHEINDNSNPPSESWYQYVNPNVKKVARFANRVYLNPSVSLKKSDAVQNLLNLYKSDQFSSKRHIQVNGEQARGWQNCADKYTPDDKDPETYHDSAHCLKFSNVWYSVYRLHKPQLEHSILLQVFERHEDTSGRTVWKDLTKGKMARVGTITHTYEDKDKIVIKYISGLQYISHKAFAINHRTALFLVPDGVTKEDYKNHPEVRNGPDEYLIVHNNQIRSSGEQCNVAGVGFEAFVTQPNRCSKPRGTCLANQPYKLWLHDHQAENEGKKGCFFLKNYGTFPDNPIRRDPKTREQYLVMDFPDVEQVTVNFEIKADFNTILSTFGPAKITEVYIDSTYSFKTIIIVKITNSGLVSGLFSTRLQSCPLEIPASFGNIESDPTLIPPQHQHTFHLEVQVVLPLQKFHCTVEALNHNRELVAMRRILIRTLDRCMCTWHCLCACLGTKEGLKCNPMSLQHYHAAGFRGSLPITAVDVTYTFLDEIMTFVMYLIIYFVIALLLLGLFKGIFGAFLDIRHIGMFGLDIILDLPQPIPRYYEYDLKRRDVVYDCEGWPINPKTGERVRCIQRSTELCINLVFFFIYPFCLCLFTIRRLRNKLLSSQNSKPNCYCVCDCHKKPGDGDNAYNLYYKHGEGPSNQVCPCRFTNRSKNHDGHNKKIQTKNDANENPLPQSACQCTCRCGEETESKRNLIQYIKDPSVCCSLMSDSDEESLQQILPPKCRCDKEAPASTTQANEPPDDYSKRWISKTDQTSTDSPRTSKSLGKLPVQSVKSVVIQGDTKNEAVTTELDIPDPTINDENLITSSSWTDRTSQTDEYEIEH